MGPARRKERSRGRDPLTPRVLVRLILLEAEGFPVSGSFLYWAILETGGPSPEENPLIYHEIEIRNGREVHG
jgi:hypothetical protein